MNSNIPIDGLLQLLSSVVLFGSMFVPLKKYDAGDGFFAQWIMSVSILIIGFLVFSYQSFVHFYPVAMLGGCFWALGNCMAIPIIQRLGMALGILIWNSTNCLVGWGIGTFGIFGIQARPADNMLLSYFGLFLVFIGGIMFLFVKNKPEKVPPLCHSNEYQFNKVEDIEKEIQLMPRTGRSISPNSCTSAELINETSKSTSKIDRIVGIILALISGSLYGINIAPVIYVQDNSMYFNGAPADGLPYAFSHFFGVFIMCTLIFVIYAICKKNRPVINPSIPLPALLSGLIWAIAQTSLLNATANLSAAITYPISAMLPGCVAAIWSIFYFREIRGTKNLILMVSAIFITLAGAICIGASK